MSMTDPIADFLTRIRNANMARHEQVQIPASRLKQRILEIMKKEGYIKGYKATKSGKHDVLEVSLKYLSESEDPVILGLKRISRPGLRQYVRSDQIPRVRNGMGTVILTTSQGVMSDREAREKGIGGELICSIW